MGAAVSPSHAGSAAPSSSRSAPAPAWGPFHGRRLSTSCPSVGPLPWGAVPQEQAAPAWVPHGVTSPASKPAPAWAPLSTGPQVLAGVCSVVGSPWGHSLFQAPPALVWGPVWALGGGLLPHGVLHVCRDSLPHHGLLHGCRGTFLSGAWSTSCPPSALTWWSAELLLSHRPNPLSGCRFFFPF